MSPVEQMIRHGPADTLADAGDQCDAFAHASLPGANRALVRSGVATAAGSPDPNVVVRPDALHDQEAAAAVPDALQVTLRPPPDRAAHADLQPMLSPRPPPPALTPP